jgi:3'(2'), 5'-bisphosphate nucleotidase
LFIQDPRKIQEILLAAMHTSIKAGDAIREVYNSAFSVQHKIDQTPLTAADRVSHQIVVDRLSSRTLCRFPVLSEEGKAIPFEERTDWEYFWLVDPLDGTKEFIDRNGEFTVNIALIHKARPVLGVIFIPDSELLYFGAEGLGAYKLVKTGFLRNDQLRDSDYVKLFNELINVAEKLPLRDERMSADDPGSPFTVIGSRSHRSKETEDYIERLQSEHGAVERISAGSSLKFCLVAEGRADVYPRFGTTMEWDTAAGQSIVEQSGGRVVNSLSLSRLAYNKKDLKNPHFIAWRKGVGE